MSSIELFGCWWGHEDYKGNFIPQKSSDVTNASGAKVAFYNCSGKAIKYVHFDFAPYNSVKDVCDDVEKGKLTGPIEVNEGASVVFDNLWFNATISGVLLLEVELEYMDGSTEKLKGSELTNIYAPSSKAYANSSIHIGNDEDYNTYFDDFSHANSYVNGDYVFNEESTFYKNYKTKWEESIEKYKQKAKKDQVKNKIKLIVIVAIIAFVALAGILPNFLNS